MGNVALRGECGGVGICGKCKVQIVKLYGTINGPTEKEKKHLSEKEIEEGYRLACQAKIDEGKATVYIPPESRTGKREISSAGLDEYIEPDSSVKKINSVLKKTTFEDIRTDYDRLCGKLSCSSKTEVSLKILEKLPELLRKSDWNVTAAICKNRIISLEKGDTCDKIFGIAVDIGSSKVICHLVNLITGETVERANSENPQVMFGEDIVSRITYASKEPENLKKLQRLVIDTINSLIDTVCKNGGVLHENIYELVFVGNSVMHHLFLGITPKYIGVAPFIPAVGNLISFQAKELGVNINEEGFITAVPLIGGFIGSDAVANLLITKIYETDEVSLVIDIGTNTEILLGNSKGIMACSTPSGPSFEGAHISSGMKAVSGAIESVKIEENDVTFTTIDNAKPKGICGSGIIDLVACMYNAGIITRTGKFKDKSNPRIKEGEKSPEYIIAEGKYTENGKDITITEKDINEFLLAKGSIRSGWKILHEKYGIDPMNVDKVYLAGSFGTHVNIENAITLGIIPGIDRKNIVFAGETAVGGAKIALKSLFERDKLEKILKEVEYIELSVESSFSSQYLKSIPITGA
ncbi:uncharacterized 2Fe-2S/4Fe-4S cluster protein (DUF4445 family) [Methanomicrobium sp. W14]|nr:uncharacterized 2Fe-2S/4Fe-4S cluster protein (DUF4445 family) [Methanomicrobium sp. W14]